MNIFVNIYDYEYFRFRIHFPFGSTLSKGLKLFQLLVLVAYRACIFLWFWFTYKQS